MKKILVIEDVDFNRDLVVQLLEDKYQVIEAVNGQEGVSIAEKEKPELILMDLSLPVMDGWEATRVLKANSELRSIPVIALTAHAMKGDEEKALAAGCDDYLVKPIDEDELMVTIEKYIN
jgi:two-component system cell cycle response regulator DivK